MCCINYQMDYKMDCIILADCYLTLIILRILAYIVIAVKAARLFNPEEVSDLKPILLLLLKYLIMSFQTLRQS